MTSLKDFPDYAKLNSHLVFRNRAEKWLIQITKEIKKERKFLANDFGQSATMDNVTSAKMKIYNRILGE